jgi:Acetyltransferase (GNAT) domain
LSGPQLEHRELRKFHLSFFFGDLCFYTKWFPALIIRHPFDPHKQPEECPRLGIESLPPEVEAVFQPRVPLKAPLPPIIFEKGWIRYAPRQLDHYYTDLNGSFDDYLKKFTGKTRSELRRQLKVFTRFCGDKLDLRMYKTPQELEDFHPVAHSLAARTYQEKLFQGGLPDDEKALAWMRRIAQEDKARGYLLFHGEATVAYLYLFASTNYIEGAFLGYDPEYKQWSPGTLLQYLALKDLFDEGRFEFYYWGYGEGQAKNKIFFSTGKQLCADIYYLRDTVRNRCTVRLHRATALMSKGTGRLLERFGVRRRLKQMLRWSPTAKPLVQRAG